MEFFVQVVLSHGNHHLSKETTLVSLENWKHYLKGGNEYISIWNMTSKNYRHFDVSRVSVNVSWAPMAIDFLLFTKLMGGPIYDVKI